MKKISILLKPNWSENRINSIEVQIDMESPCKNSGEKLFELHREIVGVNFLSFVKEVSLQDENGDIPYNIRESSVPKIKLEEYILDRQTSGNVRISYECKLRPCGKNPAFDLGYEDGGMSGSGMSFMPCFGEDLFSFSLDWNLDNMPENSRGIWSLGEGNVKVEKNGNVLGESFYYAGKIKGTEENGCGFYWLENEDLPGEEVGVFVKKLFSKMADFFGDSGEPYNVFSRKVPLELTGRNKIGGLALTRSFLYLYPMENPPTERTLKFLFPHELVHNWPKLEDEPFGECTWYVEGTAEYYSMVLTDRFGMLNREELIEQLNKRARDYYENPLIEVPNQYAGDNLFVDPDATLVPYGRGFFYMLHMDELIHSATNGKKNLDDVVLSILTRTRSGEKCGNSVWLEEVSRIAGIDVSEEFAQMQNGKIFPPSLTALTTKIDIIKTTGVQRKTEKKCVLYQFK